MGKICVAVIIYKPDKKLLQQNLNSFSNHVDRILIWENMTAEEKEDYRIILPRNASYIGDNCNIGISRALNKCLRIAHKEDYEYFMSMDQDSIWMDFSDFKKESIRLVCENKCLVGPVIYGKVYHNTRNTFPAKWLITSGMFAKTLTLSEIGGYNEAFFVDTIDIELCLRAKKKDVKILMCRLGKLKQSFGDYRTINVLSKKIPIKYYNKNRIYNIFRGNIIVFRLFKNILNLKELIVFLRATLIAVVINQDHKRWGRLSAILKGTLDGLVCNINKYKL